MGYKHRLFISLGHRGFFNWMKDKLYLKISYFLVMGRRLNLDNPKTYTEKLQWIKLYDRKKEYTNMVDKYAVYDFVKKRVGEEYLIPLLGVWECPEQIDWDQMPNSFVLKCTHDSGGVIVIKDKKTVDKRKIIRVLNKKMSINYFYGDREWPYKNIKPRIIAQSFMVDESGFELKDYKFFCFNGVPRYMFVAKGRIMKQTKFNFYDMDFNKLDIKSGYDNFEERIEKPRSWEMMKKVASKLSEGIPHVRVDLYEINGKIYFGEMTFFHWSGFVPFEPRKWDYIFGEQIVLPNLNIKGDKE